MKWEQGAFVQAQQAGLHGTSQLPKSSLFCWTRLGLTRFDWGKREARVRQARASQGGRRQGVWACERRAPEVRRDKPKCVAAFATCVSRANS